MRAKLLVCLCVFGLFSACWQIQDADAHTPTISTTCLSVTVDLFRYDRATRLVVVVDGRQVESTTFSGGYRRTFTGSSSWRVTIDNAGTEYDLDRSGTFGPCATTTSTSSSTTSRPIVLLPFDPPATTTTVPIMNAPTVELRSVPLEPPARPVEPLRIAFTG